MLKVKWNQVDVVLYFFFINVRGCKFFHHLCNSFLYFANTVWQLMLLLSKHIHYSIRLVNITCNISKYLQHPNLTKFSRITWKNNYRDFYSELISVIKIVHCFKENRTTLVGKYILKVKDRSISGVLARQEIAILESKLVALLQTPRFFSLRPAQRISESFEALREVTGSTLAPFSIYGNTGLSVKTLFVVCDANETTSSLFEQIDLETATNIMPSYLSTNTGLRCKPILGFRCKDVGHEILTGTRPHHGERKKSQTQ